MADTCEQLHMAPEFRTPPAALLLLVVQHHPMLQQLELCCQVPTHGIMGLINCANAAQQGSGVYTAVCLLLLHTLPAGRGASWVAYALHSEYRL